MEGDTLSSSNLISTIKSFKSDGKEQGTIKALLKNLILPDNVMAIKQNQSNSNKHVYSIPITSSIPTMTERTKTINEAKQAFLNSTVNTTKLSTNQKEEPTIHYAQIAITKDDDDPRSTGGGKHLRPLNISPKVEYSQPIDITSLKKKIENYPSKETSVKKKVDTGQRKVSFKIKNASTSYRRPPITTKTMMTIPSSKVSELTKKFNNLQDDTRIGSPKHSKFVKKIEEIQTGIRCSASNSSTPSSTLSSSPNIKILVRQRKGSKKRYNKKRCSSMDSIDKVLSDSSSAKICVIRSKSDGTKIPKSPKKRLHYQDANDKQTGSDSVDGPLKENKAKENEKPKTEEIPVEVNVVKNAIKKFESEINGIAINNVPNNTLKKQSNQNKSTIPLKEKPKVPEKKSSLVLTKNIVVKDGVPKIKTIKPSVETSPRNDINKRQPPETAKRKEPIYDRKKYKTNYIHTEKLPLQVVEIIPEEINESIVTISNTTSEETTTSLDTSSPKNEEKLCTDEIKSQITPNESFLWRRKSNCQIYADPEKSESDSQYSIVTVTVNDNTISCSDDSKEISVIGKPPESNESQVSAEKSDTNTESNSDFESNLVEAYNKEILVGFTSKPKKETQIEDDYEILEPRDTENIVIIPIKSIDRHSKINCPLPEIPKQKSDNVYQCLLEMRSHPEGDENSLHNYELCENQLEERTRGDGDSDDGYEYCKTMIKPYCLTSSSGIQIAEGYNPNADNNTKNYTISKSVSGTSTVSYEKIGSERIYEKIPPRPPKSKDNSPTYSSRHSFVSDYTGYNDNENIYDTIKHSDGTSLSHCYESIPNSPSMVKMRNNLKKQLTSAVQKRLSFDTVSNISQSTMSSEQKTNSIYGQRSVISFNGQEIAFQVPSSETSVSDRSDRSDDWVDVSDEEKNEEQRIIIVREKSRGRKSPISWSQKVRHQWQKSPSKPKTDDKVLLASPSNVYLDTSVKSPYYSKNDDDVQKLLQSTKDEEVKIVEVDEQCWISFRTVLRVGETEIQDLIAFLECDSSDSGHLYESLEPLQLPLEDDFDSFDSDSDSDGHEKSTTYAPAAPALPSSRLPSPPSSGGQYTLTKIASAAQRKMRQIKRNLTKRYSVAMDGKPFMKSPPQSQSNDVYEASKTKSPVYANYPKPDPQPVYTNITFNDTKNVLNKTENSLKNGTFKEELKTAISEMRPNGDVPPPLPEKLPLEKPVTPTSEKDKKDSGTLSRKAYFSFKSRFRRATSMAVDINEVPSALKITNSTFYLTDSMDGDSGFSNCSDNGHPGSSETLSARSARSARRRDGRPSESTPCLALERPAVPPPPPPTDLSAVHEELKRLLPTLSRKDKSPRTRSSWYADCGADTASANTSTASWYAEAGLYQAGNISSSSGASSGSHPASPLPQHSLFTQEPLYQFYNAAKVESVCRETGDSDSDGYEATPSADTGQDSGTSGASGISGSSAPVPGSAPTPVRPSAMALVAPRGPSRTLWCEVPEVVNSAVLSSLAPAQKRLQEAKFELLTSEASYLNSLNVLETHFISHPAFREPNVLSRDEWETLFGAILPVRKCSQLLMTELERCWQESVLLHGISSVVRRHAEQHFHVYVAYCAHQALMVRALQALRDRPAFQAALRRMESHPECQSLSLHSFLMLPMQRVTRLPLLMDAVLRQLPPEDPDYHTCMHALATLNHFVSECNEGARSTERTEEMYRVARLVTFPATLRDPPCLGPACNRRDRKPTRWLVRSGEMTQLVWKTDELKLTFGKKFHKVPLYLFLFNDLLVITKKKSEQCYVAVDHCPRSLLEVCSTDNAASAKHALLLTLLENHEGRTIEMLVSCASETEARRWEEALAPARGGAGEAVYGGWDCPQVCARYAYSAAQPDELPLAEGDVVNVTRKTTEGWYYGERTRDGEAGWFPGAYTTEIASPHVRARNLRQRYRLLALSATYTGQKRRAL